MKSGYNSFERWRMKQHNKQNAGEAMIHCNNITIVPTMAVTLHDKRFDISFSRSLYAMLLKCKHTTSPGYRRWWWLLRWTKKELGAIEMENTTQIISIHDQLSEKSSRFVKFKACERVFEKLAASFSMCAFSKLYDTNRRHIQSVLNRSRSYEVVSSKPWVDETCWEST